MRKFLGLFVFCTMLLAGDMSYAGVRFITDAPRNSFAGKPSSSAGMQVQSQCASAGYSKTVEDCGKGRKLIEPCPYSSKYYRYCCEAKYRYTQEYCILRGMKPSSSSCAGKYACH